MRKTMNSYRGLPILLLTLSALALFASAVRSETSPNVAAFKKLQSLAGNWEGKDAQGKEVKTQFKLVVSNTAVMESLDMPGMEEMMTFYTIDGDGIALVHFCPTNNQPRMRAVPTTGDAKELDFHFLSAGNLPSPATGHEQRLVLQFEDKDHITETWTWQANGKDHPMVFHFTRAASK
jgi:hypothetical protein